MKADENRERNLKMVRVAGELMRHDRTSIRHVGPEKRNVRFDTYDGRKYVKN